MGAVKAMYMELEEQVFDVVDEAYLNACTNYSDFVKSACVDVTDCYPTMNKNDIIQICADIWNDYHGNNAFSA